MSTRPGWWPPCERWRIPRSRAKKIVDSYDQGGRTPAEVRAALLTDYIYTLPAARGALAHAAAGGNARLLAIGPAEGAPRQAPIHRHGDQKEDDEIEAVKNHRGSFDSVLWNNSV